LNVEKTIIPYDYGKKKINFGNIFYGNLNCGMTGTTINALTIPTIGELQVLLR